MIYLSHLLIDTGSDPDRLRPGRMWLNNIYNVHRRLSMAFPQYKRPDDPHFLQPFDSEQYKHPSRPFLFRVDNNTDGNDKRAVIIVQSSLLPDWDWCFHNAQDFLIAPPECKPYNPIFSAGQTLRFRIRINASTKRYVYQDKDNPPPKEEREHKRVGFSWSEDTTAEKAIAAWFTNKASGKGFSPLRTELIQLGWVHGSKPESRGQKPRRENEYRPLRYKSALLEGYLRVDDPDLFTHTQLGGLGSAKSMGFGLLSVMPVNHA